MDVGRYGFGEGKGGGVETRPSFDYRSERVLEEKTELFLRAERARRRYWSSSPKREMRGP